MRCWRPLVAVSQNMVRREVICASNILFSPSTGHSNTHFPEKIVRLSRNFCSPRHPGSLGGKLSPARYLVLWTTINNTLSDMLSERTDIEDLELGSDVIKVIAERSKVIVINSHVESKQIWYSSPVSGPRRFDLVDENKNEWRDRHNQELMALFNEDLKALCK